MVLHASVADHHKPRCLGAITLGYSTHSQVSRGKVVVCGDEILPLSLAAKLFSLKCKHCHTLSTTMEQTHIQCIIVVIPTLSP